MSQEYLDCFTKKWKENSGIDIKTAFKWTIAPALAKKIKKRSSGDNDTFIIQIDVQNPTDDQLSFDPFKAIVANLNSMQFQDKIQKKIKKNKKGYQNQTYIEPNSEDLSQNNINKILNLPSQQILYSTQQQCALPISNANKIEINFQHTTLYITGRYQKNCRTISQSPWICDNQNVFDYSIQEEIAKNITKQYFETETYKFHAGGREDIDVRMLGNGRPFVLEIINPKNTIKYNESFLKEFEQKMNQSQFIQVQELYFTDIKCFEMLKKASESKIKAYSCVIYCHDKITDEQIKLLNEQENICVKQKTPIRVMHRRTMLIRDKMVYQLRAYKVTDQFMVLFVLSSAGMYIKEFIHGDLNRTKPNIGTFLKTEADILQLDVIQLYQQYDENSKQLFNQVAKIDQKLLLQ